MLEGRRLNGEDMVSAKKNRNRRLNKFLLPDGMKKTYLGLYHNLRMSLVHCFLIAQ